jgi:hypothetical protein
MNLVHAIPQEELLLGQLTTSKLGKVMHGFMSVGIASLEMASPIDFLSDKDKVPLGFLEVLRCISIKPGHADKIELLGQQVNQLSDLTIQFHRLFLELANWRTMSSEEVHARVSRLGDCYAWICQSLEAVSSLLGKAADYSEQSRQDRNMLEGFFHSVPVK